MGALSRSGVCRPFAGDADGLLMGEGIGAVVLKRLSDALQDGDRIYAAIRAVGVASDGRATAVMTPRVEGQILALRRAYEEAGIDPQRVTLVEGHGTATVVGDSAEIDTLHAVLGKEGPSVALGSVKSMIGHAMPAAGMAGLIKTALAVYHRLLPPTLNVERVNPKLEGSRFCCEHRDPPLGSASGHASYRGVSMPSGSAASTRMSSWKKLRTRAPGSRSPRKVLSLFLASAESPRSARWSVCESGLSARQVSAMRTWGTSASPKWQTFSDAHPGAAGDCGQESMADLREKAGTSLGRLAAEKDASVARPLGHLLRLSTK